jgi:hypothetical protein
MEHDKFETEVDRNYDVFERMLPGLLENRRGEIVLMRAGQILSFHISESEALAAGRALFPDGVFSIQEVTDRPADLGFFSHAFDPRLA